MQFSPQHQTKWFFAFSPLKLNRLALVFAQALTRGLWIISLKPHRVRFCCVAFYIVCLTLFSFGKHKMNFDSEMWMNDRICLRRRAKEKEIERQNERNNTSMEWTWKFLYIFPLTSFISLGFACMRRRQSVCLYKYLFITSRWKSNEMRSNLLFFVDEINSNIIRIVSWKKANRKYR